MGGARVDMRGLRMIGVAVTTPGGAVGGLFVGQPLWSDRLLTVRGSSCQVRDGCSRPFSA